MGGCMCESTGHPMGVHVGPRVWAHVCGGGSVCTHLRSMCAHVCPCVHVCMSVCTCRSACPCARVLVCVQKICWGGCAGAHVEGHQRGCFPAVINPNRRLAPGSSAPRTRPAGRLLKLEGIPAENRTEASGAAFPTAPPQHGARWLLPPARRLRTDVQERVA